MDRELMVARHSGCRDCELDAIRQKFNDIARARDDEENRRTRRLPRFGP